MDVKEPLIETAQPFSNGLPGGDLGVRGDDEGQGALNGGEGIDDLHQAAQADLFGKVARRNNHHRKDDCHLGVPRRKPTETLLALHDLPKVLEYAAEPLVEHFELDWFAAVERNALRILTQPDQAEPEVSLEALAGEIQWHQRATDFDSEPGARAGIDQRGPNQIGRDVYCSPPAEWDLRRSREPPENDEKGA